MEISRETVLKLLRESIDELNQLSRGETIGKSDEIVLLGASAVLDSLAFVNFVATVEEKCESHFGTFLSLTEAGLSESGSIVTLGDLADGIVRLLQQKRQGRS